MNQSSKVTVSLSFMRWLCAAVFVVFLLLLLLTRFHVSFNQDELEAVHTAWKMTQGQIIYRDFFQHHHPLLYYLLMPLIRLFGETLATLFACRVVIFLFYNASVLITYFLGKLLFNRLTGIMASALLLSNSLFAKLLEIRPDGPQTACALLATLLLFRFFYYKKMSDWLLSAIFFALSFLFLQKIIFLLFFVVLIMVHQWWRKVISLRDIILYALTGIFVVAPYYCYLWYTNTLIIYFKLNWLLNILHPERFYPPFTLAVLFSNQLLMIFYVFGLCYYCTTTYHRYIAALSIGLLFVAIVVVKFSFAQYYAPAIPFMALIAGTALYHCCDGDEKKILLLIISLLGFSSFGNVYFLGKKYIHGIGNEQYDKINYVLNHSTAADCVYDGKSFFNVFRNDCDYFWFEARMNHAHSALAPVLAQLLRHTYDLHAAIERCTPKIISSYYIDQNYPEIKNNYVPIQQYDDLLIRK